MLKKINWPNVALIAGVALIVVLIVAPLVRPFAQKVPFLGKWVS